MKKALKITGIILSVLIIFCAGIVAGAYLTTITYKEFSLKKIDLLPEQFMEDFTEINNIVKRKYSHLENKRINIDSLFQIYSKQIQMAKTSDEYTNLLLAYFAELRNGHTRLFLPTYSIHGEAKLVENRVFIDEISRSLLAKGINLKDEILAVDGVPVLEWLAWQQKFVSASTNESRRNRTVERIFSNYSGGTRTLLLNTQTGEKEVVLSFIQDGISVSSSTINDYIGYIAINSMAGNVVAEFRENFEKVRHKPVLIVDLRNNDGGNSANSEEIAKYLIREKQIASVSRKNLKPATNHYEGKLIVLIGVKTFSAAESFVLDLKESGNAILIGSKTAGHTGNRPTNFTTRHGTFFRMPTLRPPQVSPKGRLMDGGFHPHFEVYLTVDDYLNDVDTVLEFAINKISGI